MHEAKPPMSQKWNRRFRGDGTADFADFDLIVGLN
jgi:hypothetical protein